MKTCTLCKICQDDSRFSLKVKETGQRQSRCKECSKRLSKQHYRKNKDSYLKRMNKGKTERAALVNAAKSKPCADCGISYPPYVMDLDHLEADTKTECLSHMVRDKYPLEEILAEIRKCEVVCSNCHRVRTHNRQNERA